MGRTSYEKFNYLSPYPITIGPAKGKPGCMVEAYRIEDPRLYEFVLVRGQNVISRTANFKHVRDVWKVSFPERMLEMLNKAEQYSPENIKKRELLAKQKLKEDGRRKKRNAWQVGDLVAFRRDERLRMRVVRREESKSLQNPFGYEYWGVPLTKGGQIRASTEPVKISPANWRSMRARGIYKLFKESRSEKISKYLEKSS